MPSPLNKVGLRLPTSPVVLPSLNTASESRLVNSDTKKFGDRFVMANVLVLSGRPHSGAGMPGLKSVSTVVGAPGDTAVICQNRPSPGPSPISIVLPTRAEKPDRLLL